MLVGLAIAAPLVLLTGASVNLTGGVLAALAVAGIANSGGLVLGYAALRRGKVGVVGPIISTEGAIGAVLAVLAGDPLTAAAAALLAVIALGVVLAAMERPGVDPVNLRETRPNPDETGRNIAVTTALALGAAILFGINLFATSRIAVALPLAWAILPARLAGVVGVSLPLILSGRLRLTRAAVPFVILVGIAEVAGVATFATGARDSAAITAVIASQFAAIAAIVAFAMFGERLSRVQVIGVGIIATGVATLAALRAFPG
jgi:drug/metabolite transporter (DMT)-like permease